MQVTLIGIDLAKNIFQVCGVNRAAKPVFNRQIKRNRLLGFLAQYPDASVAMEACSGSNFWGRELNARGFNTLLIPPQHVKPFVKGNKNDRNDAFAITEAARRPNLRTVQPRTLAQTEIIQVHRHRERKLRERTALINQLRGFLGEYGIVVKQGKEHLFSLLPEILDDAGNGLSGPARLLLRTLYEEWQCANQTLATLDRAIKQQAIEDPVAKRLTEVKGIAVQTASALIAYAGNGSAYGNGRQFSANLGLVPREHSSGGKQQLGGITKRGNSYLRRLLIQGAWSVLRYADRSQDRLSRWARQVLARRGKHKAVVAIANKLARIAWSMIYHGTAYRAG